MKFLATCDPGLEEVAIQEVKELINSNAFFHHKGAISFEGKEEDIFKLNFLSRSLNRIILLLKEGNFESLEKLYKEIKDIQFGNFIYQTQTFAIRAERFGKRNFTSLDIAKVAGQAVIDSYKEEKGIRLKVNLDNPNIIIRVEVREDKFWIGLDTTGENSLHKRWYRKFSTKAPLKSTIAYGMIRLANLEKNERMIDPFCGSGTIPIEAYLYLNKIVPNQQRDFAFTRFFFLDRKKFLEFMREEIKKQEREEVEIYGCDIKESEVEKAIKNAEIAGAFSIKFFKCDARGVDLNYDKVITDLPFGVRSLGLDIQELYSSFFKNLEKSDFKKIVFITLAENEKFLPSWEWEKILEVEHGNLKTKIFVFSKS